MGPLGFPELIIIFVVALIVFGPRKLPELGRSLGRGLSEFKKASNDLRHTLDDEIREEERKVRHAQTSSAHSIKPPAEAIEAPVATPPAEAPAETVARGAGAPADPSDAPDTTDARRVAESTEVVS